MALPDLIEIMPLTRLPRAEITVPGSKSITNRALVLAALGNGTTTLRGALWSEDTQVMVECLRRLGFEVQVETDSNEPCNRSISVAGLGGQIPQAGSQTAPVELFVGNAGTAARFLLALVCLGQGYYRLNGVARMHERPQAALISALRQLGYDVTTANDRLPATVRGTGPQPSASCEVSIQSSSQFASALLLAATVGEWKIKITGSNVEESPYVEMTRALIKAFPKNGGTFQIEPDASSGSYFWGAGMIHAAAAPDRPSNLVSVRNWPTSGWQIDERFPRVWPLPETVSRSSHLGDSIMTAIVLAPFSDRDSTSFTDLGRLRVQECERVAALRTELTKCGGKVIEIDDTLTISKSALTGAEIETYNDHRMAMCFALLGLRVPGIVLRDPACVKKTFPNFFQKLSAPAPEGLGAIIRDAKTKTTLTGPDLFAD